MKKRSILAICCALFAALAVSSFQAVSNVQAGGSIEPSFGSEILINGPKKLEVGKIAKFTSNFENAHFTTSNPEVLSCASGYVRGIKDGYATITASVRASDLNPASILVKVGNGGPREAHTSTYDFSAMSYNTSNKVAFSAETFNGLAGNNDVELVTKGQQLYWGDSSQGAVCGMKLGSSSKPGDITIDFIDNFVEARVYATAYKTYTGTSAILVNGEPKILNVAQGQTPEVATFVPDEPTSRLVLSTTTEKYGTKYSMLRSWVLKVEVDFGEVKADPGYVVESIHTVSKSSIEAGKVLALSAYDQNHRSVPGVEWEIVEGSEFASLTDDKLLGLKAGSVLVKGSFKELEPVFVRVSVGASKELGAKLYVNTVELFDMFETKSEGLVSVVKSEDLTKTFALRGKVIGFDATTPVASEDYIMYVTEGLRIASVLVPANTLESVFEVGSNIEVCGKLSCDTGRVVLRAESVELLSVYTRFEITLEEPAVVDTFAKFAAFGDSNDLVSHQGEAVLIKGKFAGYTFDSKMLFKLEGSDKEISLDRPNLSKQAGFENIIDWDLGDNITFYAAISAKTPDLSVAYLSEYGSATNSDYSEKGTAAAPYTVEQARERAKQCGPVRSYREYHVTGYVVGIESNPTFAEGKLTYRIASAKDKTTETLLVSSGLFLDSAAFNATNVLELGDKVTVCGHLMNSTTTECTMTTGNRVTVFTAAAKEIVSVSTTKSSYVTLCTDNPIDISSTISVKYYGRVNKGVSYSSNNANVAVSAAGVVSFKISTIETEYATITVSSLENADKKCQITFEVAPVVETKTATLVEDDFTGKLGWANGSYHQDIALDENITATLTGGFGGNNDTGEFTTGTILGNHGWRMDGREGAELTISSKEGYLITSVKIVYGTSTLVSYLVNNGNSVDSGETVVGFDSLSATSIPTSNSVVFTVAEESLLNLLTGPIVRIEGIEVTYVTVSTVK